MRSLSTEAALNPVFQASLPVPSPEHRGLSHPLGLALGLYSRLFQPPKRVFLNVNSLEQSPEVQPHTRPEVQ